MVKARSLNGCGGRYGAPKAESRVPTPINATGYVPTTTLGPSDLKNTGLSSNGRCKLVPPSGNSLKVASTPGPASHQRSRTNGALRPSRLPLPQSHFSSNPLPESQGAPASRLPVLRRTSTPSTGGSEPGSGSGGTQHQLPQLNGRRTAAGGDVDNPVRIPTPNLCNNNCSRSCQNSPSDINSAVTQPHCMLKSFSQNGDEATMKTTIAPLVTGFHRTLQGAAPSVPPSLSRGLDRSESQGMGRVKVMLRIAPISKDADAGVPFLQSDARQKQLTVYEPPSSGLELAEERHIGVAAPKMFAFDAIFSPDDPQDRVCSKALGDVLPAVVNGSDACVFTYGYSKLGKSNTMIGDSDSVHNFGLMPSAISWLFKLIHEQREKTGARFSVRVSATEIAGKGEVLRDLLASYAKGTDGGLFSPGKYLKDELFGQYLQNQSELRVPTAEKAAFYLDAAIAASSSLTQETDGICHFLFTLHIYQYRVDKSGKEGGVDGGRSRLYLMDLGACERQSLAYSYSKAYRLSLANLGNVILGIFNGQKHVPYKDSKLTQLLRAILGNITCQATMIAHVSPLPARYTDSMATIQLASRIHRLRHKKWKNLNSGCGGGGSADDPLPGRFRRRGARSSGSDVDCTSSSEQSCDTVIFLGPSREKTLHEGVESMLSVEEHQGLPDQSRSPGTPKSSYAQIRHVTGSPETQQASPQKQFSPLTPTGHFPIAYIPPFCAIPESTNTRSSPKQQTFCNGPNYNGFGEPMTAQRRTCMPSIISMATKNQSKTSDEFWIDGPRMNKTKFEPHLQGVTVTNGCDATSKEMWVDGPQATQQQMHCQMIDNQKRAMIERWIDMQTLAISVDTDVFCCDQEIFIDCTAQREAEIVSNVDSFVSGDTESDRAKPCTLASEEPCRSNPASLLDDIQSKDYADADFYNRVMLHISELGDEEKDNQRCLSLLLSESESAELEVAMMDSSVQVTEDEILHACHSLIEDHPLRVLSSESLAVSFTNSSRVSWDSGLNAMRRTFGLAPIGPQVPESEARRYLTFDTSTRSVHSDPGSGYGGQLCSEPKLNKGAFGSSSLENLPRFYDESCAEWIFPDSKSSFCGSCDCSVGPFCSQCDLKALRRPDGSSDPHLNRHPSEADMWSRNRNPKKNMEDLGTCDLDDEMVQSEFFHKDSDLKGDSASPKTFGNSKLPVAMKRLGNWNANRISPDFSELVENDWSRFVPNMELVTDAHPELHNISVSCIEASLRSDQQQVSNENGCDSQFMNSSIKTMELKHHAAPDPRCELAAKGSYASYDSPPPPIPPRLDRKLLSGSPAAASQRRLRDRLLYDSGTGSSRGSTRSSELAKEEPKKDASLGTSSGYESMLRGCEGSSGTTSISNQDSLSLSSEDTSPGHKDNDMQICDECIIDDIQASASSHVPPLLLDTLQITQYEEEDIERMERRRALEKRLQLRRHRNKILQLRQKQYELKKELSSAKSLLMIDPSRWTYDLYVEESMDEDDPSFVEALARETLILEKRVTACKSRVSMVTSFDTVRPRFVIPQASAQALDVENGYLSNDSATFPNI